MSKTYWVYILKCVDDSFYTGSTSNIEKRISEHKNRVFSGYTSKRLPVKLVYSQFFDNPQSVITAERQIKKWTRAKKIALINGDFNMLKILSKKKWKEHK